MVASSSQREEISSSYSNFAERKKERKYQRKYHMVWVVSIPKGERSPPQVEQFHLHTKKISCVPPNPPLQRNSNFDEETTTHYKETNSTSITITITTHRNLLPLLLSTLHSCNPVAISACYSHHPSPSFHVLGATIISQFPCSLCSITTHPGSSFVLGAAAAAAAAADSLAISACYSHYPSPSFHVLGPASPVTQDPSFSVLQ
jgi:hypothetical protein